MATGLSNTFTISARPPWFLRVHSFVQRYADAICWGLFSGVWLYLSIATWATWANLDIDCGRDVYIPARIAGLLPGGPVTLYRDLQYQFGPLIPYAYALLFRLFGLHLNVVYLTGLLVCWGIVACTYVIAARLASRPAALLTALTVLIVFAFRSGNFNYIFPYTLNVNFGLLFLALMLVALIRAASPPRIQSAFGMVWVGCCAAISLLLKQEYGLVAMLLLAFALWDLPRRRPELNTGKIRAWLLAPLALPALIYSWFLAVAGWHRLIAENLFAFYIVRNAHIFYGRLEAIHLWRAWFLWQWRLRQWLIPSLLWVLALTALWAGLEKYKKGKFSPWLAALFLAYPAWLLNTHWALVSWRIFDYYFWPFTALIFFVMIGLRIRRLWTARESILFLLSLAGLILLSRAWGDPTTRGYNNPLIWPSVILLYYALLEWLPRRLFGRSRAADYAQFGISLLLAAALGFYWRSDLRAASMNDYEVSTSIGMMRSRPVQGLILQDMIRKVASMPGHNLLVIPEDQFIYPAVGKVSPLPYTHLIVSYIKDAPHEMAALRRLRRDPPQIIVLLERNQTEYFHDPHRKPREFGQAYARRFMAWIHRHYRLAYDDRYAWHWGKIYLPRQPGFARGILRPSRQSWE